MSKLAHSNQDTMDQIEAQALADEKVGKPQDPPESGYKLFMDGNAWCAVPPHFIDVG